MRQFLIVDPGAVICPQRLQVVSVAVRLVSKLKVPISVNEQPVRAIVALLVVIQRPIDTVPRACMIMLVQTMLLEALRTSIPLKFAATRSWSRMNIVRLLSLKSTALVTVPITNRPER